jgi:hypothetical protein
LRCADAVDANYPSTLGLLGLVMPLGSGTQFTHDTCQQLMSWRFLFCLQLILLMFDVYPGTAQLYFDATGDADGVQSVIGAMVLNCGSVF